MRGGVTTSSMEIVTPERVAQWKPAALSASSVAATCDLRVALGEVVDDGAEALLVDDRVDERVVHRQRLVEQRATERGLERERLPASQPLRRAAAERRDDASRRSLIGACRSTWPAS